MSKSKVVTALYDSKNKAMRAINNLESMGYKSNDISFLVTDNTWKDGKDLKIESNTKAPEGATVGGVIGGIAGAVAAGVLATGAVVSSGAVLAAGPAIAALAGAGAGGASGGLLGGLVGMGFNETEAKYVNDQIEAGQVMIGVNARNDSDHVDTLETYLKGTNPVKVTVH